LGSHGPLRLPGRSTRPAGPQAGRLHRSLPIVLCSEDRAAAYGVAWPAGRCAGRDRFRWQSETPLPGGRHAKLEIRVIEPQGSNAARPQDPEARRQQLDKGPDQKQLLRPLRRARVLRGRYRLGCRAKAARERGLAGPSVRLGAVSSAATRASRVLRTFLRLRPRHFHCQDDLSVAERGFQRSAVQLY
jgi:hypothetical protein